MMASAGRGGRRCRDVDTRRRNGDRHGNISCSITERVGGSCLRDMIKGERRSKERETLRELRELMWVGIRERKSGECEKQQKEEKDERGA